MVYQFNVNSTWDDLEGRIDVAQTMDELYEEVPFMIHEFVTTNNLM